MYELIIYVPINYIPIYANIKYIGINVVLPLGADRLLQHAEPAATVQGAWVRLRLAGDCLPPRLHRPDPLPHPLA